MLCRLMFYFFFFGYVTYNPAICVSSVLAISGACTLVESLPINLMVDDNISVPAVAAFLGYILFPAAAAAVLL